MKKTFAIAAVSVLAVLLSWAVIGRSDLNTDLDEYYRPTANSLINGDGYYLVNGDMRRPAGQFPPGFPLILAGTYTLGRAFALPDSTAEAIMSLVCTTATSVMLYYIARLWWGERGWVAGMAWATYPIALSLTLQPNSESPFMLVMLGAVFLLWHTALHQPRKVSRYFISGMLFGAAVLIRPFSFGLIVGAALTLYWLARDLPRRSRVGAAVLLLLGQVTLMLPWQIWASGTHNQLVLLDTWHGARDLRYGLTYSVQDDQPTILPEDAADTMEQELYANNSQVTNISTYIGVIFHRFVATPLTTVIYFIDRLIQSWYGTSTDRLETLLAVIQIPYVVVLLASAWRTRTHWQIVLSVLCLFAYFWAVATVTYQLVRYLLPGIAFLFILVPNLLPAANRSHSPPH